MTVVSVAKHMAVLEENGKLKTQLDTANRNLDEAKKVLRFCKEAHLHKWIGSTDSKLCCNLGDMIEEILYPTRNHEADKR